jgi:hypothetical protein
MNYHSSYSSYPSSGSLPDYVERLRDFLLSDVQLQALFEEATQKVSLERFEKNFKRCLQQFSKDLEHEAKSNLLVEASKVVYKYSGNAAHLIRRFFEIRVKQVVDLSNTIENRVKKNSPDDADDVVNPQESEVEHSVSNDSEFEEKSEDFPLLEAILKESTRFKCFGIILDCS